MTSIAPKPAESGLYDRDFALWCAETAAHLKAQEWGKLDVESLIEEVEGLAGRDRREISSRLDVLLSHLLKRLYIPRPDDYRGWEATVRDQRRQIKLLLKQSPSLKNYFSSAFDESWQFALEDVRANYPQIDFPDAWHYSREAEDLLSRPFWLEAAEADNHAGDR